MNQSVKPKLKAVLLTSLYLLIPICQLALSLRSVCKKTIESTATTPLREKVDLKMNNVLNRLVIFDVGLAMLARLWQSVVTKLKRFH